MKYIYEFITPSDPITFRADNDNTALLCAVVLGEGKAGAKRYENGEEINIDAMQVFNPNAVDEIEAKLGCTMDQYIQDHRAEVSACFHSFAYGSIEDRQQYDDACEAITDPEKLKRFKSKAEDRQRTSMSKWVQQAWRYGDGLLRKEISE